MAAYNKRSASNYDDNPWAFTFTWAIENWPVHFFPSFVESPSFHTEILQDTKWRLRLRSAKKGPLLCTIHRYIGTTLNLVDVLLEISFLGSDGSNVLSITGKKCFFSKYETCEEFKLTEDAFRLDRARFIINDTLTIRCIFWSADSKYLLSMPPSRCFENTRLAIERRTLLWCVRDFSQIPIGEPGVEHGIPHLSITGYDEITLNLKIKEISGTQQVLITILEDYLPQRFHFNLSILDKEGKKNICNKDTRYDLSDKYCTQLGIIKKDVLMKSKGTMLFNDDLCLRCEFEIENGPARNYPY
ncbi:uncharacterized protein TNIN_186031 [Trichonephila inaurata madagascariensis]|uniref:MATH domain-containing protein n=1 Tax=Trichonephila inaurata madagascariensis TaxID=2747483 RepID=A0A8X6M9R0_9ARAC|nr:uncharacterized protein TNIN_186031 [Trichonephila inaurata madagascariensis]